jgi:hypothetical protein
MNWLTKLHRICNKVWAWLVASRDAGAVMSLLAHELVDQTPSHMQQSLGMAGSLLPTPVL